MVTDTFSEVTRLAQNGVFERFARAGYAMSGLLHLIIGYLAIRIALGSSRGDADPSGALAAAQLRYSAGSANPSSIATN